MFLGWALSIISVVIFVQTCFSLYLALYAWNDPRRLKPESLRALPAISFTVLIPARHEEAVIAETVRRVCQANYPDWLLEVLVICSGDDQGTISAAQNAINGHRLKNARVVVFVGGPINKPRALNVGLEQARGDYVAVFDAEDDVHAEIFLAVNALILKVHSDIVQGPVQLMNYASNWHSLFGVLEYFVWFNSRLRLHARKNAIPLGGNTVFIRRKLLEEAGGWDPLCLTEDAEIGIRLSASGASTHVLFNPALATREETPHSLAAFIRQRTRWHQGFIQVIRKGHWLRLHGRESRYLAFYTLFFPVFHSIAMLMWPVAVVTIFLVDLPVGFVLVTLLPMYGLVFWLVVNVIVLWEFTQRYNLPFRPWAPLVMLIGFIPYQWVLGISSLRAVLREVLGDNAWEKTTHLGVHRRSTEVPSPAYEDSRTPVTVD